MASVLMSHMFQCESEAHFFTNFCYSSPLVEESVRALKPRVTMVRISLISKCYLFLNWDKIPIIGWMHKWRPKINTKTRVYFWLPFMYSVYWSLFIFFQVNIAYSYSRSRGQEIWYWCLVEYYCSSYRKIKHTRLIFSLIKKRSFLFLTLFCGWPNNKIKIIYWCAITFK